jgi:ribosome-associated toxin RatA of RatAB toxin-antitoxin module
MNAIRSHLFKGARATELFPIFADVEAYPSFVPGLKSAKIIENYRNEYKTKIVMAFDLGFFTFEEELDSLTRKTSPVWIEVFSTGSRFIRSFRNSWHFRDVPNGCDVEFKMNLDLATLPWIVRPMLAFLAETQAEKILQAFVARVEALRLDADVLNQDVAGSRERSSR